MTKQGQKGRIPFKCYSSKGFFMGFFKQMNNFFQVITMFYQRSVNFKMSFWRLEIFQKTDKKNPADFCPSL